MALTSLIILALMSAYIILLCWLIRSELKHLRIERELTHRPETVALRTLKEQIAEMKRLKAKHNNET
jgi:hypothetical protein